MTDRFRVQKPSPLPQGRTSLGGHICAAALVLNPLDRKNKLHFLPRHPSSFLPPRWEPGRKHDLWTERRA